MKVYYLNDEQKEITLRILDATYDHTYTKSDNSNTYHRLRPAEGRVFEVILPEGTSLWIKKWPGMVMLSYVDDSALAQLDQPCVPPLTEDSG